MHIIVVDDKESKSFQLKEHFLTFSSFFFFLFSIFFPQVFFLVHPHGEAQAKSLVLYDETF